MSWRRWVRVQWDRCAAWLCIAAGAVCLLVGWIRLSSTPYPAQQISFLVSGGLTGVFLLGLGAMLWLSADLRDQWFKLDRIESELKSAPPEAEPDPPAREANGASRRTKAPTRG